MPNKDLTYETQPNVHDDPCHLTVSTSSAPPGGPLPPLAPPPPSECGPCAGGGKHSQNRTVSSPAAVTIVEPCRKQKDSKNGVKEGLDWLNEAHDRAGHLSNGSCVADESGMRCQGRIPTKTDPLSS